MTRVWHALLALCVGVGYAQAQVVTAPQDLSAYATTGSVSAAIAAASPNPCSTPLPDTLTGSAGTQPVCMTRPDATRPTVVQAKDTVTASDATWSVTFDRPFVTPPVYVDARIYGQVQPYLCSVQSVTATGASGKCYQLVATTLPVVATSLLGLVVSPFSAAGGNLSVRVVARQ